MSLEAASRLISVLEAANRLGVSVDVVWDLIRDAKLDSLRVGRRRAIPLASLEEFISRGIAEARRPAGAAQ